MATGTKSLLNPEEAAEYLGLSTETLAQWRSRGKGPSYIKLEGRVIRYRASELEDYLEESTVKVMV